MSRVWASWEHVRRIPPYGKLICVHLLIWARIFLWPGTLQQTSVAYQYFHQLAPDGLIAGVLGVLVVGYVVSAGHQRVHAAVLVLIFGWWIWLSTVYTVFPSGTAGLLWMTDAGFTLMLFVRAMRAIFVRRAVGRAAEAREEACGA